MIINCSENCIHQNDGLCYLDHVSTLTNITSKGCEFFEEGKNKEKSIYEINLYY